MAKVNAAIFVLTQNTETRKVYLKTCLYFLFRHYNERFKYPVVIFHEGDYDQRSQEEVIKSVRTGCRSLVSFRKLDAGDFIPPQHIDMHKAQASIDMKCTPYWRNMSYRNMCRWWIVHMPRYAQAYEYIMRVDDDLFIEEPINDDMIANSAASQHVYVSNMIHIDCPVCCFGFKELLCNKYPDKAGFIEELFQKQEVPVRAHQLAGLRSLLSVMSPEKPLNDNITLWSPVMNYNNFHITKSSFWMREDVRDLIDTIDKYGLIYYFRLGDSPIQSAVTMLLANPSELGRVRFRYSKRMQRECHHGDDDVLHSYMPPNYTLTSDITEST